MTKTDVLVGVALATIFAMTSWRAEAAITEVDIGINPTYSQTGPTTVTSTGGFFSARTFLDSASDFDSSVLTYPGAGSPVTLTPAPGPTLNYGLGYGDLSSLNAAYPFGTYTFNAFNSTTLATQTDHIDYTVAATALSIPTLTAASYTALQGLNPSSGLTVDFNSFLTNPNANQGFLFVSISDAGGNDVFSQSFTDLSVTSFSLPGGTLSPGGDYTLDINFDERITGNDGTTPTTIFFDTHTDTAFSTSAVPEPAGWALMLVGLGGLGAVMRSRRRVIHPAV